MNNVNLISEYKNNEQYRKSFNSLSQRIFDIDFEPWCHAGHWNDWYICYSFIDEDDSAIANCSVNLLDLIIYGSRKKSIQIGTVMTHPDYRGHGLS